MMKKLLLYLLLSLFPIEIFAQSKQSVVTLKNGTELKGVIKSIDPTDALIIEIAGIETTIKMADVAKVEEEKGETIETPSPQINNIESVSVNDMSNTAESFVAIIDGNRFFFHVLSKADRTVEIAFNKNVKYSNDYCKIPSFVKYGGITYNVIAIGEEAFCKNTKIKILELPNTIVSIGEEAFCNCTKLSQVKFSAALKEIGEKAFAFCVKLNEIDLPQGLLKIDEQAFQTCPLEKIDIPNSVTFIGRRAFFSANSFIGQESRIKWLSIPESVVEIGKQAFCKFINLMGTALPSKCHIELLPSWLDENEAKRIGISEDSYKDYIKTK